MPRAPNSAFVSARKLQQDRNSRSSRATSVSRAALPLSLGVAPRALPKTYRLGVLGGMLSPPAANALDALATTCDAQLVMARKDALLPSLGAPLPPLQYHIGSVSAVAWAPL